METLIIGHRGYKAKYVENTIESLIQALVCGADGIELDVHLSKDGEVMVYHDFELSRLTNLHGQVSDYDRKELQSCFVGGVHIMPTLKEVLVALDTYQKSHPSHVFYLNVELKAGSDTYPHIEEKVLELTASYPQDRIIYSSFDHLALVRIKQLDNKALTGVLTSSNLFEPWTYLNKCHADFYHPHHQFLTKNMLSKLHAHDVLLNVYTVDDPSVASMLIESGVHMVITNEVEQMVALKNKLKIKS